MVAQIIVIKTPFLIIRVTRDDLKHCGKMPDVREELNRSERKWKIESRHSIKSLEWMGSRSYDLVAKSRMRMATLSFMKTKL